MANQTLKAAIGSALAFAAGPLAPTELPEAAPAMIATRKPEEHDMLEREPEAAQIAPPVVEQAPTVAELPPGRQIYDNPIRRHWDVSDTGLPQRNNALLDSPPAEPPDL
jgi:hypothetical protein